MDRTSTIVLGLIFLIGVAGFLIFLKPNDLSTPDHVESAQTYENTVHGFSLSYPSNYSHVAYTPDIATIGHVSEEGVTGVAEARTFIVDDVPGESLTETVIKQLAMLCAADGPTGSFSCSDVSRSEAFTTLSGREGTTVYLSGELHEFASDTRTQTEKGPYVIIPLDTPNSVLVVHAPLNQSADEAQADLIIAIAKSVTTE